MIFTYFVRPICLSRYLISFLNVYIALFAFTSQSRKGVVPSMACVGLGLAGMNCAHRLVDVGRLFSFNTVYIPEIILAVDVMVLVQPCNCHTVLYDVRI